MRPKLYKLLLDFAERYVPLQDWHGITVNQNYAAAPHKDKGNKGFSYLVSFGEYQGGDLQIHGTDLSGCYDIRYQPVLFDGSSLEHSVKPFEGKRYSLVFYKLARDDDAVLLAKRRSYEPLLDDKSNKWRLFRRDENGKLTVFTGLDHPLKGRTKL